MRPSKSILFDVDGTLSDSWNLGFTCTQKVMKSEGYEIITEDQYHQGTKYSTPRRFAWHVTGNPEDPIGKILGQKFDDLYVDLVTPETTTLYPGILTMLQNLKAHNIQLGALSNACGAYVKAVLDVNELNPYFTFGLGADEVPQPKPQPDGLLQCAKLLNISPSNCIYIGDSPSDGHAAAAAGMKSVGVTWGSHPADNVKTSFDYCVHTVSELEQVLLHYCKTGELNTQSSENVQ